MGNPFYHKDDGKVVGAKALGFVEFDARTRAVRSLLMATESATYNGGTTLGAAGSSPFGDETGATFDGSTGYLQLPGTDQISTGPNTVELWFKMPACDINGGVLFDEEQCALTNSPVSCGGYDPALYVGTDGRLHGEFWINNISAQITSTGLVNDGKWHYVVLSASTSSQSLYLDGTLAGTQAGTLSATGLGYVYVGAGAAGGSWPFAPVNSLGYFQGSISDLAFYPSRVDECTVDGEVVRSQPGDFYGGWITAEVVGPFKGDAGTMGW